MSGRLEIESNSSGAYAPEDIESFLEAAEEVAGLYNIEPDQLLCRLTRELRKRADFEGLKNRFDCRRQ
jgi:hypothetical protein